MALICVAGAHGATRVDPRAAVVMPRPAVASVFAAAGAGAGVGGFDTAVVGSFGPSFAAIAASAEPLPAPPAGRAGAGSAGAAPVARGDATPVPEPGPLSAWMAGLAALGWMARRRGG